MLAWASSQPSTDPFLFGNNFPRCRTLRGTDQLHAHFISAGLLRTPAAAAGLILRLCASFDPCHHFLARRIFFSSSISVPRDDCYLWNAVIKSCTHGPAADSRAAALAFALMLAAGVSADRFSFSLVLKACSQDSSLPLGLQVHAVVLKSDLAGELYLNNCLIGLYSRCGRCELALQVFDRMQQKDSVSWNTMIDGYTKNGRLDAAKVLFGEMKARDRNLVTWNTMIGCYASSLDGINDARDLFDRMPERDLFSWNLIISGYVKLGRTENAAALFAIMPVKDVISWTNLIAAYMEDGQIDLARQLFDEMPERDLITWNAMISGYVNNGSFAHALNLFHEMRTQVNLTPDATTLASVLSAISELGRICDGIAIHEYTKRNRFPLHGKLGVALIDMYSNCGKLEEALKIFNSSGDTVDHWNAILGGLAIHGYGKLALELFKTMEKFPLKPDAITFIAVLNGCSHAGLVHEGLKFFEIMKKYCKLEPKVQHYGCIVDILGRAGWLDDAWKVIVEMPMPPNDIIWRSLLSACRKRGDIAMGWKVAEASGEGGFCDSSSYVLLSNMYAGSGLWGHVGRVRRIMRQREVRKIPGCSWIEVDGSVHEFVVGDISNPSSTEIYSLLELVNIQLE
uniref:Chlororespiratory reduction 4 n=1 Tax=Habenaria pantlingiana TaxID=1498489 RepID=A0A0F7J277_9ASPA|nr:chlororespiratory reduction 4 [Habenaria pantlingiana]